MSAAVEVRDLVKRYGDLTAVDRVGLTVHHGEVYGFLGPNGAGKTTTLRMLLGLIRPTSGTLRVLGRRPGDPDALARTGSMIEAPAFYPFLSGRRNLAVVAAYAGVDPGRIDGVLADVGLADRGGDRFSRYSLGMKQRLGVAAALLKDPDLVVLDEPTNGLDPQGVRDMRDLIRRLGRSGRTVILSSHMLAEVQAVCDRVGVIDHGRMVTEGTVEELRGETVVELRATPGDVVRATIAGLPGVDLTGTQDGTFRLRADEADTPGLVRALVAAGADVHELRRSERQLEDVFFEVTRMSMNQTPTSQAPKEASHV